MRNLLKVVMALLAVVLLMGMGSLGGTSDGTIPKTSENVRAQLVDRSGVSSELTRFSMDGNVALNGRRGDGQVSVPFRDLKEVSFGPVSGSDAPADLLLKSGKRIQLKVEKSAIFYGDMGSGTYRITAEDVNRIMFLK